MKKPSPNAQPAVEERDYPNRVREHEHVHAMNCGHKSFVHGTHIDYEHDGHWHYTVGDKTYKCEGPNSKFEHPGKSAKVIPFPKKK